MESFEKHDCVILSTNFNNNYIYSDKRIANKKGNPQSQVKMRPYKDPSPIPN